MHSFEAGKVYRFGTFEFRLASRQLLRNGRETHLQEQPMRLLVSLLDRPGELVTREELRERLWPTETFVEFDDGLNTAVQKMRQVLADDARNPRFVETVPRRGYRFIAPVHVDERQGPVPDNGGMAALGGGEPPVPAIKVRRRPPYLLEIGIPSVAAVTAVGWLLLHWHSGPVEQPLKLSITPPPHVELRPGFRGGSAIAPDGRSAVFVGSRDGKTRLWLRSLDSLDARELPGTGDAQLPFWSPDGRSIGFVAGRRLRRISLAGGPPQDLAVASRPTRGSWFEDGTILFSPGRGEPLYRVSQTGGKSGSVTEADAGGASWPYAIPATNQFLYFDEARASVVLGSLSDRHQRKVLFQADSNAVYVPAHDGQPGYLFWIRGTALVAQVFQPKTGKLSGEPFPVAEGVGFADLYHFMDLSVSRNGVLLYGAGDTVMRRMAWLRRDGSLVENVGEPGWLRAVRLSPDGHRAVVEERITRALWMQNFDLKTSTRLTYDQRLSGWPAWSPDGSQVVYSGERGGPMGLLLRNSDGATPEKPVIASSFDVYVHDWSRDGKYLAYCEMNPRTKLDIWILPLAGGKGSAYPLLQTPFNEDEPQFSPDVRWISYVSDETGRSEVYVATFPGHGGKWQISTAGGTIPRWSGDGRELFYLAADGYLMSVPLKPSRGGFEWLAPHRLFAMPALGSSYDVSTEGSRFLALVPTDDLRSLVSKTAFTLSDCTRQ